MGRKVCKLQNTTILEIMRFKLRDCIAEKFIYAHDAMENDFFQTASEVIKRELLRTNDAGFMDTAHWRNMQVARQAAEVAALNTACMNCIKMIDKPGKKSSDIILDT
jgi:hypothetical protein